MSGKKTSDALWVNLALAAMLLIANAMALFRIYQAGHNPGVRVLVLECFFVLVLVNILRRPPAERADTRLWVVLVCTISVFTFLAYDLRQNTPGIAPQVVQGMYWYVVFPAHVLGECSKLVLGRSFAVLPALRQIQTGFMYRWVRHPIYLLYIVADTMLIVVAFSPFNLAICLSSIILWLTRIRLEEQVLGMSDDYQAYMLKTRWRLIPGLY